MEIDSIWRLRLGENRRDLYMKKIAVVDDDIGYAKYIREEIYTSENLDLASK